MGRIIDVERSGPDTITRTHLVAGERGREKLVVETVQDTDRMIEANKREYNSAPETFGKGVMHKVADVPMTAVVALARKRNVPWGEVIRCNTDRAKSLWNELLNSNEFRAFRTRPGRVNIHAKG